MNDDEKGFHLFDELESVPDNSQSMEPKDSQSLNSGSQEIKAEVDSLEEAELEFLTFRVGGELFAVYLLDVREVIEQPRVKSIPRSFPYFKGLFNLRGEVSGLISLREKLGLTSDHKLSFEYRPVIMFNSKNGPLGIAVDEMYKVFSCSQEQISDQASIKSSLDKKYLKGLIKLPDEMALIVNLQLILDEDEITDFRKT